MNNLLSFSQNKKNEFSNLITFWLNSGFIKIYNGTRPATPDTAITDQLLLCSFIFNNPAGTVVDGLFTASAINHAVILNSGYAVWARILDSTEVVVADCDVGDQNSSSLIKLDSLNLVKETYLRISSFTLSQI